MEFSRLAPEREEKLASFIPVLHLSNNGKLFLRQENHFEDIHMKLKMHEDIKKAELSHRYYKALKLAGAYAFVEGSKDINQIHLDAAIQLVEDSGKHFNRIINKEGSYARLARYIADVGKELTQVDLLEELPFYRGAESQKKDMLSLAVAWGYKNNIIIIGYSFKPIITVTDCFSIKNYFSFICYIVHVSYLFILLFLSIFFFLKLGFFVLLFNVLCCG